MTLDSPLQQLIINKKSGLAESARIPLAQLAAQCADVWPDGTAIDKILFNHFSGVSHCTLLYAWDRNNRIISSMVRADGKNSQWLGSNA